MSRVKELGIMLNSIKGQDSEENKCTYDVLLVANLFDEIVNPHYTHELLGKGYKL